MVSKQWAAALATPQKPAHQRHLDEAIRAADRVSVEIAKTPRSSSRRKTISASRLTRGPESYYVETLTNEIAHRLELSGGG